LLRATFGPVRYIACAAFEVLRVRIDDRYGRIDGEELYRRVATGEPLVIVDVRTEQEFEIAHIPGSLLVPLHEIEASLAAIPNHETPIAVICEQGYRSISACRFLAEHGFEPLFNVTGGLSAWPGPLAGGSPEGHHPHQLVAPSRYLVDHFHLLTRGTALDIAMGNGRNAIYLATRGFDVDGVDVDPVVVERARVAARRLGAPIRAVVGNVEDGTYIVPMDAYDLISVFNYLHRPLFRDIKDGVRPGGTVVYQTFTVDQPRYGKPSDPAFLLRPGELREVFSDWEVLHYREGVDEGLPGDSPKSLAGIVARKQR
jgi:rhodanese-related sulfurtransferase